MKKLLLLTSLLAATAGAAAADISISGDGRMGISSKDGGHNFVFSSRARVRFAGSGETDNGLKFGASFRAHEATDAESSNAAGTVFLESATMGKLTFGDVDGAAQAAVTQFGAIGYDETGKLQEFKFLTGGSTGKKRDALYTYTKDALAVSLSMGDPGATSATPASDFSNDWAVGVAYTTEFWKVAVGYEDDGVRTQTIISGNYGNGQFDLKGAYGQRDDKKDQYVVYGTYNFGVNSVNAFFRKDFADVEYQGLGVTHDFGGGLSILAAYAKADNAKALVSIGAGMSF